MGGAAFGPFADIRGVRFTPFRGGPRVITGQQRTIDRGAGHARVVSAEHIHVQIGDPVAKRKRLFP